MSETEENAENTLGKAVAPAPRGAAGGWCGIFNTALSLAYNITGCKLRAISVDDDDDVLDRYNSDLGLSVFGDDTHHVPTGEPCIPFCNPATIDDSSRPRAAEDQAEASGAVVLGARVFHPERVGACSQAGLRAYQRQLVPKTNQDRSCVCYPFGEGANDALFGMYDGHGENGHHVSEFASRQVQHFVQCHPAFPYDPAAALRHAFEHCDHLLDTGTINAAQSGTTAVTVLMRGRTLHVANAGDSRAVVGRLDVDGARMSAIPLTEDHKPDIPAELQRIESLGGVVSQSSPHYGPARVRLSTGRGGLTLSRAIGDISLGRVGVIATPDVRVHTLDPRDRCLILASDGVWEFMSNQRAVEVVAGCDDATAASEALVRVASDLWALNEAGGRDDITALVAFLPLLPGQIEAEPEPVLSTPQLSPQQLGPELGEVQFDLDEVGERSPSPAQESDFKTPEHTPQSTSQTPPVMSLAAGNASPDEGSPVGAGAPAPALDT